MKYTKLTDEKFVELLITAMEKAIVGLEEGFAKSEFFGGSHRKWDTIKHTPTPWHVELSDNATPHIKSYVGYGDHTDVVCAIPTIYTCKNVSPIQNAEHIVKCVNEHDALTAELAQSKEMLNFSIACMKHAAGNNVKECVLLLRRALKELERMDKYE